MAILSTNKSPCDHPASSGRSVRPPWIQDARKRETGQEYWEAMQLMGEFASANHHWEDAEHHAARDIHATASTERFCAISSSSRCRKKCLRCPFVDMSRYYDML